MADQKLAVLRDGALVGKYPISTSRFGVGDACGSYKTPLGQLRICGKIGENLAEGAVLKHRSATGEILPVNAPGRDPIVTRILWLEGIEEQNRNARARSIYIHGTPEEKRIGEAVSWGCIRMKSKDVIEIFEAAELGATVTILADKLPRFPKYQAPKLAPIASNEPAPTLKAAAKPSTAAPAQVAAKKPTRSAATSAPQQVVEGKSWAHAARSAAAESMRGSILHSGLPETAGSAEAGRIAAHGSAAGDGRKRQ